MFPLQKTYRLTPAKIDTQHLHLLDYNVVKIMENDSIIEDVLEETELLSELLYEDHVSTTGDQIMVSRLKSLRYIKRFNNDAQSNFLQLILLVNGLFILCI